MAPSELHIDALMEKIEKLQADYDAALMALNILKAENARYREALERIENECSRHDTTAWSIASDALEEI